VSTLPQSRRGKDPGLKKLGFHPVDKISRGEHCFSVGSEGYLIPRKILKCYCEPQNEIENNM
jgi:hypothetical protein